MEFKQVMMKLHVIIGCVLLTGITLVNGQNPIQLFNGQNLNNWEVVLQSEANPEAVFFIKDGVLNAGGTPFGYIRTRERFENFELTLEWRWTGEPTNSGVLLAISGEDKVWPHCIEAQLRHGSAGDLVLMHEGSKATVHGVEYAVNPEERWVTVVPKFSASTEKAPGEWNTYRIRFVNGELEFWVNGRLQMSATNAKPTKGYIGLQSEGSGIQFRNIEVTKM